MDKIDKAMLARLKTVHDLTEVNAKYHSKCMALFYKERLTETPGCSSSENTKGFIRYIIDHINNNSNECQFSINELKAGHPGDIPDISTIKNNLENHVTDQILFKTVNKDVVILFINSIGEKLCE